MNICVEISRSIFLQVFELRIMEIAWSRILEHGQDPAAKSQADLGLQDIFLQVLKLRIMEIPWSRILEHGQDPAAKSQADLGLQDLKGRWP